MRLTKYHLASLLLFPLFLAGFFLMAPSHAAADFNYTSHPMDDNVMRASGTMSANDIQLFLNKEGSGIRNYSDIENCGSPSGSNYAYYSTYYACGQRRSAASIIHDVAQAYGINPQAILATMQKEESLVTDPSPSSSQITYAMGYGCPDSGGCSYPGFFNQIDNGTWQFRVDMELASGNSWWGYSPSSYPCNGATKYYSAALKAGYNVTFKDDYGTGYANFTLPNWSTAALYCYTPHVYPGSSREYYSGSYWFVYYYKLWFTPYAWTPSGYAGFTDSGRTHPYNRGNGGISIAPGGKAYMRIVARNDGYNTWSQSSAHIGTDQPEDRCSQFADSSWLSGAPCQRIAMKESSVAPGGIATFDFSLTAPSTTGSYKECFSMLVEGVKWLNDPGLCFHIDVVNSHAAVSVQDTLSAGQSLGLRDFIESVDTHNTFALENDGSLVTRSDFLPTWHAGPFSSVGRLYMQGDGNLVLYSKNMTPLWNTQTSGNPGARLVIQTDGNAVVYSSSNVPLWNSGTSGQPNGTDYVDHYQPTGLLYPMQRLETANGKYKMILQPDGNLVVYSPTRAIWASNTYGRKLAFLAMQGDGNLVLYDINMHPIWVSHSDGHGLSNLVMQDDGNLVIYNSRGPTWNTQTWGAQ